MHTSREGLYQSCIKIDEISNFGFYYLFILYIYIIIFFFFWEGAFNMESMGNYKMSWTPQVVERNRPN